jgi:TPR repeat protein
MYNTTPTLAIILLLYSSVVTAFPMSPANWFQAGQTTFRYSESSGAESAGKSSKPTSTARWYLLNITARLGDSDSQRSLGFIYAMGQDEVEQSFTDAERWYISAAEAGDVMAQYELAMLYDRCDSQPVYIKTIYPQCYDATDETTPQPNQQEAIRWYTTAANAGLPNAQFALGRILMRGNGIKKDLLKASVWLNIAWQKMPPGESKQEAERYVKQIRRKLSSSQRRLSDQLITEWKPGSLSDED